MSPPPDAASSCLPLSSLLRTALIPSWAAGPLPRAEQGRAVPGRMQMRGPGTAGGCGAPRRIGAGGGARGTSGGGARSGSRTVSPPGFARCVSSLGPRQDGGPVSGRAHTETRCDGEGKVSDWEGDAAPRARRPPSVRRVSLRVAPLRGLGAAAASARPGPAPALAFPLAEVRACGAAPRCDWRRRPSLRAGAGVGPPSRPLCLALRRWGRNTHRHIPSRSFRDCWHRLLSH